MYVQYRSHNYNMQNKQLEQHLRVQQPQLADKKIKWAVTQYQAHNILSKPVYTHTNIPIHWASNQSQSREWP